MRRKLPVGPVGIFVFVAIAVAIALGYGVLDQGTARATTGSIFVTNEWSTITNENPAPAGYTFRPSVYGTYAGDDRLVQTNADIIKVIVEDDDYDDVVDISLTDTANITVASGGDGDDTITLGIGNSAVIQLTGQSTFPIAGPLDKVHANTKIISGGVDLLASGDLSIANFFSGNPGNDPWIQVVVNASIDPIIVEQIDYVSSEVDSIVVTVTSDLEPSGITIVAEETELSSGRFEGYVQLVSPAGTSLNGTPGGTITDAGSIQTGTGPVTVTYDDDDGIPRQTMVLLDTDPPNPLIIAPINGSATQNQRPTFSGSILDAGSGLDISTIRVVYDDRDDPGNFSSVAVISAPDVVFVGNPGQHVDLALSTASYTDGDPEFSFSQTPASSIPGGVIFSDHIVDWVIVASDLAGNIGVSDARPEVAGIQLPTVKIDNVIPAISPFPLDNRTGLWFDGSNEVSARDSLRVVFNDQLDPTNVHPSDFTVQLDSGTSVEPVNMVLVNDPFVPAGYRHQALVYLRLPDDLASDETPVVSLQDTISDIAGNSTKFGSGLVYDGIAPVLNLTTSGGSGTGAGDEGPGGLTNRFMDFQVTSDEPLSAPPQMSVFRSGNLTPDQNPTLISAGVNTWTATIDLQAELDGLRSVTVSGTDAVGNSIEIGDNVTPVFRLAQDISTPIITVGPVNGDGTVLTSQPTITIDFASTGQDISITLPDVLLNGAAITETFVPSNGNRTFTATLTSEQPDGPHTVSIPGGTIEDSAANVLSAPVSMDFDIETTLLVDFSFSPDSVSVRDDEPSVVTVSVNGTGSITPDTVQINLAHDDGIVVMQNPQCVGLFSGGTASAVARDTDDLGSFFTCSLVDQASGTSGPVATFEVMRVGTGNPITNLRLHGDAPTSLVQSGVVVGVPGSSPTLDILPGTSTITGHITVQGVTEESAFAAIGPTLTLQNTAGGSPTIVPANSDGTFALTGVLDGTYDLTVKADGLIDLKLSSFTISSADLDLQTVEVKSGLADGNDIVEAVDVSAAVGNFGLGPTELNGRRTADTDLLVDFDGDGFVTGFDISIVVSNVGLTRPQAWTDPTTHPLGYLGATGRDLAQLEAASFGLPITGGFIVETLDPLGPAEASGVAVGDVIVQIDSTLIRGEADLAEFLQQRLAGDDIEIFLWWFDAGSGWQPLLIDVTLATYP